MGAYIMIQVIYIPVLFVCMNGNCEFMQSMKYFTRESECRTAVEEQKDNLRKMALKGGSMVTLIEGTCITLKNGML
jgi:hypothetical protein